MPAKSIPEGLVEPRLNVEPVDPNRPILTQLPSLKVVHCYDPHSGDMVTTREDLVVVINSETKKSTFVQHADGTHMYSEVTETYPSNHIMSQGEVMMDQLCEIYPKNPRVRPLTPPPEPQGEGNGEGEEGVEGNIVGEEGKKKQSVRKSLGASLLPEPPPIMPDLTTIWHVHKEGLAKVHGKVFYHYSLTPKVLTPVFVLWLALSRMRFD